MTMSLAPWPCFDQDEIDAASAVLASGHVNYWTGEQGRDFEREFAAFCGSRYAIAVANGTLALELALRALGIGEGDEVIVTPRTFMASASAVVMVGATPVFADVDLDSQNITAETIAPRLTENTRAIICVHLAGWPCDMDAIKAVIHGRPISLIEDCAQAHGALYKGEPVGSLGDVGAFSFCQDKIMTTGGEGGMLTLNDEALWKLAWSLKDHGKDWDAVYRESHPEGFRWLHRRFGSNYRLTEFQSAIGRIQLTKLAHWRFIRQHNSAAINLACREFSCVRIPEVPDYVEHACYKHYLFIERQKLKPGWSRDRIQAELQSLGVPCFSGSCPEVYLEGAFSGSQRGDVKRLPNAQRLGETSLMFLVHPTITAEQMAWQCEQISSVLSKASA